MGGIFWRDGKGWEGMGRNGKGWEGDVCIMYVFFWFVSGCCVSGVVVEVFMRQGGKRGMMMGYPFFFLFFFFFLHLIFVGLAARSERLFTMAFGVGNLRGTNGCIKLQWGG